MSPLTLRLISQPLPAYFVLPDAPTIICFLPLPSLCLARRPLSEEQLAYAATDAWVLVELLEHLLARQAAAQRALPPALSPGWLALMAGESPWLSGCLFLHSPPLFPPRMFLLLQQL